MWLQVIPVGDLQENCCLISRDESSPLVLIDPGAETEKLLRAAKGRPVAGILLTHGHFDHIGALDAFPDVPVYIHPDDLEMLADPEKNASLSMGCRVSVKHAALPAEEGAVISLGGIFFTVWHTPGHSRGSVCYLTEEYLFTGDTLFHRGSAAPTCTAAASGSCAARSGGSFPLKRTCAFFPDPARAPV